QTPGDYVIFATSADVNPNGVGNYTLKLLNNVATQLNYSSTPTNQTIATTDLQTSAGDYLDVFWFNGVNGDNVQIDMNSTAFDSLLVLQRNNGDFVVANDNVSQGNPDSRIVNKLAATGIYIIIATPFEPNKTGAYTLTVNKTSPFSLESGVEFNEKVPGRELRDNRSRLSGIDEAISDRYGRRRIIQ